MATLYYFPVRGRGEVVRLAHALKNVPLTVSLVDWMAMKADPAAYPFGQCPRYVDDEVDITQSNAILRHISRKHQLCGSNEKEHSAIDVCMETVESLRNKYLALIYQNQLSDDAKKAYIDTHVAKEALAGRNGGAHLEYLARCIRTPTGWVAGTSEPNIGDLCVFEIVDLHLRIMEAEVKALHPDLVAFHDKVASLPQIAAYLPTRLDKINANNLG